MPKRLHAADPGFEAAFAAFLATKREAAADVDAAVREIIAGVRAGGDRALIEMSMTFDAVDLAALGIRVTADEIQSALGACSTETLDALVFARDRIVDHHERQRPAGERYQDALGVELGHRWTAVDSAGLYVPGGLASYPSSVLMCAVPARVAGVAPPLIGGAAPRRAFKPPLLSAPHPV